MMKFGSLIGGLALVILFLAFGADYRPLINCGCMVMIVALLLLIVGWYRGETKPTA